MVESFGEKNFQEDIVQEAYIRLYKYNAQDKIVKDGEVVKGYMWVILRNTYYSYISDKQKLKKVCLSNLSELSDDDTDQMHKKAQSKFDSILDKEMESWHWYDRLLFKHYKDSGDSLRSISKETGISLVSLWNTVKNCKDRVKESLHEDYEDLLNNDWELL